MNTLYYFGIGLLLVFPYFVSGVQYKLHPAIKVCKRSDPNIKECYCENIRTMIPLIKDGVPEMNILPIDPIRFDNIVLDWSQSHSLKMVLTLFNISANGLADAKVPNCDFKLVETGMYAQLDIYIPVISLKALYKAVGAFSLLKVNTTGDLTGQFKDARLKTYWTSSLYTKKGKEYLNMTGKFDDVIFGNIQLHFSQIFGNNTEMTEMINTAIADNTDVLYSEVKQIVVAALETVSSKAINHGSQVFPFNILFPLE